MRRSALVLSVAFLGVLAGTARVDAGVSASDLAAASPVGRQLEGTWRGSFAQVSGGSERDQADCVLKVKEDGTFTAHCVRSEPVTTGVSKAFGWSGRVVPRGRRFVLQTTGGLWPSVSLTRSGSDRLAGMTRDPQMDMYVMMEFERAPDQS